MNGLQYDISNLAKLATTHVKDELGILDSINQIKYDLEENPIYAKIVGKEIYKTFIENNKLNDFYSPKAYPTKGLFSDDENTNRKAKIKYSIEKGVDTRFVPNNMLRDKRFNKPYFKLMKGFPSKKNKNKTIGFKLYKLTERTKNGVYFTLVDETNYTNESKFYTPVDYSLDIEMLYDEHEGAIESRFENEFGTAFMEDVPIPATVDELLTLYPELNFDNLNKNNC
jgi:hypothetical protein